jgi:hypothetical protein
MSGPACFATSHPGMFPADFAKVTKTMFDKPRTSIRPPYHRTTCDVDNGAQIGISRQVLVFWLIGALVVTSVPLLAFAVYGTLIVQVPAGIVIGELLKTDWLTCATSLLFLPIGAWNSMRFRNPVTGPVLPGGRELHRRNSHNENDGAMSCTNDYFINLSVTYGLPAFSVPDLVKVPVG